MIEAPRHAHPLAVWVRGRRRTVFTDDLTRRRHSAGNAPRAAVADRRSEGAACPPPRSAAGLFSSEPRKRTSESLNPPLQLFKGSLKLEGSRAVHHQLPTVGALPALKFNHPRRLPVGDPVGVGSVVHDATAHRARLRLHRAASLA